MFASAKVIRDGRCGLAVAMRCGETRSQERAAAGEDGRGMAASCSFICLHSFSSLPVPSLASASTRVPNTSITHPSASRLAAS